MYECCIATVRILSLRLKWTTTGPQIIVKSFHDLELIPVHLINHLHWRQRSPSRRPSSSLSVFASAPPCTSLVPHFFFFLSFYTGQSPPPACFGFASSSLLSPLHVPSVLLFLPVMEGGKLGVAGSTEFLIPSYPLWMNEWCIACFVLFCFVWLATLGVPVVAWLPQDGYPTLDHQFEVLKQKTQLRNGRFVTKLRSQFGVYLNLKKFVRNGPPCQYSRREKKCLVVGRNTSRFPNPFLSINGNWNELFSTLRYRNYLN